MDGLIGTLQPEALTLREKLLKNIPPRAAGRGRTRESFNSRTSVTFDGVGLAETAANLTCRMIFHPARATRLVDFNYRDMNQPGLEKVLSRIINGTLLKSTPSGLTGEIKRNVDFVILDHLMSLAINKNASPGAQSISMAMVGKLEDQLKRARGKSDRDKATWYLIRGKTGALLEQVNPDDIIKKSSTLPFLSVFAVFNSLYNKKTQMKLNSDRGMKESDLQVLLDQFSEFIASVNIAALSNLSLIHI